MGARAGSPAPRPSPGPSGAAIRTHRDGRPSDLHIAKLDMDIHHGLSGNRLVVVKRGNRRIVAGLGSRGYVETSYRYGGREYGHRTYSHGGQAFDYFYYRYAYRGTSLEMYVPTFYYAPAFYGWAYNSWAKPVLYTWNFLSDPWYRYYGGYFAVYPAYSNAAHWLTDYMISDALAASYQSRANAQQQIEVGSAALTTEVKNLVADEVRRQIATSGAEAQVATRNAGPNPALSGLQRTLTDNAAHVFIPGRSVDVVGVTGLECTISGGNALQLAGIPLPQANSANLIVLSSKGGKDCRKGMTVSVSFADLQDMQNYMRETIDRGFRELQTKQGRGGLPVLPASANARGVKADFASAAPPPDPTAADQINEQIKEADKAEAEALAGPTSPDSNRPLISEGQSIDEVIRALGPPLRVVDLGVKKIYTYKDIKIIFSQGRVSEVQ
jgi:hypothetical protein